ncbi:MAG: NUDIX hydrolase [Cyclobacteriaceae bacterium]
MSPEIPDFYQHRTRIRVCGLCWQNDRLLMVNHRGLTSGNFWAPPGGGVEFAEGVHDTLVREFLEETNVKIKPGKLQFACEFIHPPLHAVELFFMVDYLGGEPGIGTDPESSADNQLITDVRFMNIGDILASPEKERHGIFRLVRTLADLKNLSGFHRI